MKAQREAEKQASILAAEKAEAKRIQDLKDAENERLQKELRAKQDAEKSNRGCEDCIRGKS